ncbi:Ig-like domain-containing protein [Nocardioides sp.]|uniref:Ig-like domain-containing protein n=1 Tax=Nocardioides sp. TaxID=35761 RepID=UPI002628618D|nr:Ig-like domain-containing protein [Nocardioides sp.]MCW2739304.1 hypothetical protein [Nocardioides sp.]
MTQSPLRRAVLPAVAITGLLAGMAVMAPVSAATGSFTNPSPIAIDAADDDDVSGYNDTAIELGEGAGSVYPSTIDLEAPANARVQEVSVGMSLTHERMDDLDLVLVSPSGKAVTLLSDAGGDNPYDSSLYFYAWGSASPDEDLAYYYSAPTDWDTTAGDSDAFPAPVPASAPDSFDGLYGSAVSGAWQLYTRDDTTGAVGTIHSWDISVDYTQSAAPSPSTVAVSGLPKSVTDVNLVLNDLDLDYLGDTELVLESPDGRRAHVLSDAGGYDTIENLTLTLDDEAAEPMRRGRIPVSGSYQPVNHDDGDTSEFVGGLDTKNLSSALSTFDGADPNGAWKLYVEQEYCCNEGAISGGWALQITTADQTGAPVITSPTNGSRDADGTVTVTGTAPAGSLVRVTEGTHGRNTVAEDGTWSVTFGDVAEGTRTFSATATDASGNISAPATVTVVVDTVAPKVGKIKPKKNDTGVKTSVSPQVKFNEAMDPASLKRSVKLVNTETGKKVKAKLRFKAGKNLLVIDPKKALDDHSTYAVVVKKSAKDLAGNTLRTSKESRFTTS